MIFALQCGAWGEKTSVKTAEGYGDLGTANPFRYRGYYYDTETGFYYLQSRYYDPTTARFLNADTFATRKENIVKIFFI